MKYNLSNTEHWRARQAISDAAENIQMNGSCMVSAFERRDWIEIFRLYKETKPQMERLAAIFEPEAVPLVTVEQLSKLGLPERLPLEERVHRFPLSADSLAIAKALKTEGYYSSKTALCDIARRVEKIRSTTRQA